MAQAKIKIKLKATKEEKILAEKGKAAAKALLKSAKKKATTRQEALKK